MGDTEIQSYDVADIASIIIIIIIIDDDIRIHVSCLCRMWIVSFDEVMPIKCNVSERF
jgi:hypothetical protein